MPESKDSLERKVSAFLEKAIREGYFPGAAIYISYKGKKVMEKAFGYRTLHPEPAPLEESTIFDLASLTKIVATLTTILQLVDEGELHLKDKVARFFPSFSSNGKDKITIRHLLTHTSGLVAYRRFYTEKLTKDDIIERICQESLVAPPDSKVIYSDLGFIMISAIIEKVTAMSFSKYTNKYIFEPLEMHETGFLLDFDKSRFAATEYIESLGDYKYGIVHDENAESMGGVSGHAGLFSNLKDLANFAQMIENNGVFKGKQIISSQALRLSRKNYTPFSGEGRGLGWQLQSPLVTACGDLFSSSSYGHTGFTGTSIWFDPEIQLHVIFLTNRVHIPNNLGILHVRPRLHNLIRAHLKD